MKFNGLFLFHEAFADIENHLLSSDAPVSTYMRELRKSLDDGLHRMAVITTVTVTVPNGEEL